jgi:hypothetical protein
MISDASIRSTDFLDHESAAVRQFVERALADDELSPEQSAVRLYYAVRDGIFYEIYNADLSPSGLKASTIIGAGSGMCLHKSIVFAAAVRAIGIPSRLVLTDVRNHITSERLRRFIGGDVFHFHCLTAIHLDHRWIRTTPVFNEKLCQLYGMAPLEFDGKTDSLHHPCDEQGKKYMEFVREHGSFDDLPYEQVIQGLREVHPNLFAGSKRFRSGSLVTDALHTAGL